MKNFIDFLNEAKLEPGGEDLSKLFGPKGKFAPGSKDAPKEPTAFQRSVEAGRMARGKFNAMIQGIFGPPSGDVAEPKTQSNIDKLRNTLKAAGKEMAKTDLTDKLRDKIKEVKGNRKPKNKKGDASPSNAGIISRIGSFFNHTLEGDQGKLPKKIASGLNNHLATLHQKFRNDNKRIPAIYEAAKMAHKVIDAHFAEIQRGLKKVKLTSKKGTPVKITHFENMREHPMTKYSPFGRALAQVDDSGFKPNGRHLVVHVDHPHTGEYNINMDLTHVHHIARQLKAATGHDWFHVPYSEGTEVQGKKVLFRGKKSSPLLFTTSMTHPHIDDVDGDENDQGDWGDDDGGPDEPKPIVPTGPRIRRPQLV